MVKKTIVIIASLVFCAAAGAQGSLAKGVNAENKGLDDLAEGYYREAVDTSAEARLRLGMLLERTEHFTEAARWLARADSSATAMTHLAACQCELRDWTAAKRSAEKAIELAAPSDSLLRASAMASIAWVYCVDKNYTNALTWTHKAQKENPASARVLNVLGIIHFGKGNEKEATKAFKQAIQADPQNTDAYFNLGALHCYRNHHDLAITTLKKGLKVQRNSIKLIYCLGWAYLLKGEKSSAIECLQTVIKFDSTYVPAYNRLGDIHFENAEYNQALAEYRTATRLAPRQGEAYRLMGRTYAEMGEFNKAIRNYQRAAELDKSDGETFFRLAELYTKQKKTKLMQANYKRAAKLGHAAARKWCTDHGVAY